MLLRRGWLRAASGVGGWAPQGAAPAPAAALRVVPALGAAPAAAAGAARASSSRAGDDGGDSVSATDVLAQRIDGVRWRVFGSVPDHVGTPGTKRLRRKLAGPSILSWYPPTVQELHPVFYREKGQLWKVRRKCVFSQRCCPLPPRAAPAAALTLARAGRAGVGGRRRASSRRAKGRASGRRSRTSDPALLGAWGARGCAAPIA